MTFCYYCCKINEKIHICYQHIWKEEHDKSQKFSTKINKDYAEYLTLILQTFLLGEACKNLVKNMGGWVEMHCLHKAPLAILARRRHWHPTPVFLLGKSHGWRSLVGCSPWDSEVGHDWATSLSLFTLTPWRRKWQPTLVFLPGESQGQKSLVGCHLWGRTESDTTEAT